MDDSPNNSAEVDVEYSEEETDSDDRSPEENNLPAYTYDVWIFHALTTIDEENVTGTGRDIDGISKYITDRHEVPEDFREELLKELGDLVSQGHIEMVEGRYKVFSGVIEPEEPEEASDPTNAMSSPEAVEPEGASDPVEDTTSSDKSTSNEEQTTTSEENPPPQDQPSTSSSVRSESVKRLELKMLVNAVVAAEYSEFIAKEANDAFHTSLDMLNENRAHLEVATGILRNCDVLTESSSFFLLGLISSLALSSLAFCFVPCRC